MWTNEQLDAISAPNTGLIVSAAAGSGKTAVLVERLCRQICENIPVQKMVVVTFTEDAAAQLKNRLYDAIREKIAKEPENEWLARQQNMLGSAKISTISSFCFNIIRENINRLDVSPNFRIIETAQEDILLKKAAELAIEGLYKENPCDIKILDDYFCKDFEAKTCTLLIKLHRFLVSIPFKKDYLKNVDDNLLALKNDCGAISGEYCEFIKRCFDRIISQYRSILMLCCGDFEVYYDYFDLIIKDLCDIYNNINAENVFESSQAICSFSLKSIPRLKVCAELEEQKEFINSLKDKAKKDLGDLSEIVLTKEQMQSDFSMQSEVFSCIRRLYLSFDSKFEKLKAELNGLTFSDGEQLALELLSDKTAVDGKSDIARELSEYYEIIACDEYQDINNVQEMIFKLISKRCTNLFAVGDIKQSIYRFRQANPNIFLNTVTSAQSYGGTKNESMQKIILAKNFRSSKQTVDFVNLVFRNLMSRECGDVDYNDEHKLIYGANFDDSDRKSEIMLVESDDEKQYKLAESDAVALKIKSMLKEGVLVTEKNGTKRRCTYSDFCVLMGTKNRFGEFKAALENLGVKVSSITKEGYLSSREITLLCDILRIIDNPTRDISVVSVLLSPVFAMTPDEVSRIRMVNPDISLYSVMKSDDISDHVSEATLCKCRRFVDTIDQMRVFGSMCGISELIRKIYITTDLVSIMQLYSDGEKKSANLRLMLSYAQGYESTSTGGLSGFLQYLDSIDKKSGDLSAAQTVSGSDDSVSLTTIHSSKGLEYPFVFICDNRHKFNNRDLSDDILWHKEHGFGAVYRSKITLKRYDTYLHEKIRACSLRESLSESMRLLYVAMTRAKERLFITLSCDEKLKTKLHNAAFSLNSSNGCSTLDANCFEDWIISAVVCDRNAHTLRKLVPDSFPINTETDFTVSITNPKKEFFKNLRKDDDAVSDSALCKRLSEGFNVQHPDDSRLYAKLSATELNDSHRIELKTPAFALKATGGTLRGNAIHSFMQLCDFTLDDVSLELSRLKLSGIISDKQSELIDISALQTFFDSQIGKMLKSAKYIRREYEYLVSIKDLPYDSRLFGSIIPNEYKGADTMLQGVIDCLFETDDGKLILLDYKTDRTAPKVLEMRYRNQLLIYAECIKVFMNRKVDAAYIWSFENNCAVEISI